MLNISSGMIHFGPAGPGSLNLIKQVFLRDVWALIFTTQYTGSHPSIVIVRLSGNTAISGIKSWILTHEYGPCKRLFSGVIAITLQLNKMNEVWSRISHLKVESIKWNWEINTRMQNYKYGCKRRIFIYTILETNQRCFEEYLCLVLSKE